MKKQKLALILTFTLCSIYSSAQTLPVGTPFLEETWRRQQLMGERDIHTSFTIRPIHTSTPADYDSAYNPYNFQNRAPGYKTYANGKGVFRFLPATVIQQYNAHHPFGWNDGAMIQARGYQTQLSAGAYTRIGPLSIQLQPEFVFAQNRDFATFPSSYSDTVWRAYYHVLNNSDNPEKYGNGTYTKLFPGQSSIRLHYKKLSIGLSTENLWWGPGIRNSLLMSNTATAFPHLTLNTTSPLLSGIGSFEFQIISGRLKGSGILPPDTTRSFDGNRLYQPKREEDRYLNGLAVTWQPKWTPGLHLGFSRVFYQYKSDVRHTIDGYLPVLGAFFKGSTNDEDARMRDQMLSIFFRLVLPKSKTEVYGEFGRNDHAQNSRDLLLEPEHARAYLFGIRKIFDTKKIDKFFEMGLEFTQLQKPSTMLVRPMESWYTHYQVRHGYTNRGQVMGAGIGPGASSQTLSLNWIKGIRKLGFRIERVVHDNDFYYEAFGNTTNFQSHWVDLVLNANKSWYCKRFIFSGDISYIRSFNYQWDYRAALNETYHDVNNLQLRLAVMYAL